LEFNLQNSDFKGMPNGSMPKDYSCEAPAHRAGLPGEEALFVSCPFARLQGRACWARSGQILSFELWISFWALSFDM
jgi:hypothetical protein